MTVAGFRRVVHVIAADDCLARALAEHRKASDGWRFEPFAGPPAAASMVILDVDDQAEGLRRAQGVRAGGFEGPLLILGDALASGGSIDDEPIARPVRLGLLLARIDAHAADAADSGAHPLGPYTFMPAERELRDSARDETIRLTELEAKLLSCLVRAGGAVLGREELLAHVWGYSAGIATHTVETHIWRLRQKIETADPATRFLVTEPGGYRLAVADRDQEG